MSVTTAIVLAVVAVAPLATALARRYYNRERRRDIVTILTNLLSRRPKYRQLVAEMRRLQMQKHFAVIDGKVITLRGDWWRLTQMPGKFLPSIEFDLRDAGLSQRDIRFLHNLLREGIGSGTTISLPYWQEPDAMAA